MIITLWPSLTEPNGTRVELTWEHLVQRLQEAKPRPANPEKPNLAGWSAATFAGDRRGKDHVEKVTALVLDIDSGDVSCAKLMRAYEGLTTIIHSTRSYTPITPCWRIVVKTSRPMTSEEYALVWTWERDRLACFDIFIDEKVKDASRFWFVPCEPADGDFVFESLDYVALDVDAYVEAGRVLKPEVLKLVEWPTSLFAPSDEVAEPPSEGGPGGPTHVEVDELARISMHTRWKRASAYVQHAEAAIAGQGGHNVAMRVATAVVRGFALGDSVEAREVMTAWNARCEPPWSREELAHKVSEALRIGALAWGAKLLEEPKAKEEPKKEAPKTLEPAERVRALAQLGPVVRLPTDLPTFDNACRGGIPTRRLMVLGGAPGAGKTSLATFLGWRWAKYGVPVAFLAVDEGPEGVLTRIAQLEGLDANRFEERDPETLEMLAQIVEETPLVIVDADDPAGTVEGVAAMLAKYDEDLPRVLIVDSLQTVRASGTEEADSPRERVDAVVRAAKAARDRYGFLVIATCELARGSYRSRNVAETINDLAAFKESGGIEYAAQTALVLRSVPDEASLIDVTVPKNRALRRDGFRLRLDHRTTAFAEVEAEAMPASAPGGSTISRARSQARGDAEHLARLLLAHPGLGTRELRAEAKRALGWGVPRLEVAKRELGARLENRGTGVRGCWYLRPVAVPYEGESDVVA